MALLGQPAALCHVDTARFFSAALLEFGASPLAEDWYSLVSHSTLGRQTHCHNRDVKFNEKKEKENTDPEVRCALFEAPELLPGF